MVEFNTKYPFLHRRKAMEVAHAHGYRQEAEKGEVTTTYQWTDRQLHPTNMGNYDKWANDPEANIAFDVLEDIIAGVGYHTEMPEGEDSEHKHKRIIDDYGEEINLDEKLEQITLTKLQKGFCPAEILDGYDLKALPPETFYIWMNKKGHVYRYTQERSLGDEISRWEDPDWKIKLEDCRHAYKKEAFDTLMKTEAKIDVGKLEDIILFKHRPTTSWIYGKSLTEPIGKLLDDRAQMNEDMPKAVHRWAYPIPVMETSKDKALLQKACEERDVDEWIFIGNVDDGEVRWKALEINPQARFIPYIELIYYQICEGLHAPLLLYLKNATEASANVMLESVDRLVTGRQRYLKRRVERLLFKPQVNKPVPRLVWGQPKTGLEEIELDSIANLYASKAITFTQTQDILKKLGIDLIDPTPEELQRRQQPELSFGKQFEKPPLAPMPQMEAILNVTNDLGTALNIIEANYNEKRISLVKAMKMGHKAIDVHCKRMFPRHDELYMQRREQEYEKWGKRLFKVKEKKQPTYTVRVED